MSPDPDFSTLLKAGETIAFKPEFIMPILIDQPKMLDTYYLPNL